MNEKNNEVKKTTRKKCVLMDVIGLQHPFFGISREKFGYEFIEDVDNFEFEGVFLCQQLKLKTSLSLIMDM